MTPRFSVHDKPNKVAANPEFGSKGACAYFSRHVSTSYKSDILFGKLGIRHSLSVRGFISSLISHVIKIIKMSSKEKVVRVHARRVIAFVTNAKSLRDFSEVNHPRKAVGQHAIRNNPTLNSAMSEFLPAPCPDPAGFGFGYSFPKSIQNGFRASKVSQKWIGMWTNESLVSGNDTCRVRVHDQCSLIVPSLGRLASRRGTLIMEGI